MRRSSQGIGPVPFFRSGWDAAAVSPLLARAMLRTMWHGRVGAKCAASSQGIGPVPFSVPVFRSILDAAFPETLGIPIEAQPALFLAAFRHFLKRDQKRPSAMRDLSAVDVKELRAAFVESALGLLML